ncbi:MAG: hypothetical protein UY81_C0070G0001, partial [Candidatus Giovannonibacteria bacterium GW2011_GWA2_53_7]
NSNDEKNKYLGIVSHDLRSPLSTVQMYCDFILDSMEHNKDNPYHGEWPIPFW